MSGVEVPYPVESRNFLGEELVVGRCNSTGDGGPPLDDDGPSAEPMLDDILHFLSVRLNTTWVCYHINCNFSVLLKQITSLWFKYFFTFIKIDMLLGFNENMGFIKIRYRQNKCLHVQTSYDVYPQLIDPVL